MAFIWAEWMGKKVGCDFCVYFDTISYKVDRNLLNFSNYPWNENWIFSLIHTCAAPMQWHYFWLTLVVMVLLVILGSSQGINPGMVKMS